MTADQALDLARALAARNAWPFHERVEVRLAWRWFPWRYWVVRSNADVLGMNVRVEVEDRSGRVRHAGYLPR